MTEFITLGMLQKLRKRILADSLSISIDKKGFVIFAKKEENLKEFVMVRKYSYEDMKEASDFLKYLQKDFSEFTEMAKKRKPICMKNGKKN